MLSWSIFSKLLGRRERRRDGRLACDHQVTCEHTQGTCAGRLLQVSPQGGRLQTAQAFPVGDALCLESLSQGWRIEARVAWCSPQEGGVLVGLSFERPESELPGLLRSGGKPRRSPRVSLKLPARLYSLLGRDLGQGEALDLSLKGCQVSTGLAAALGEPLEVHLGPLGELPPLVMRARVVESLPGSRRKRLLHLRFFSIDSGRRAGLEAYLRRARA